jgi:hypothetical protein
MVDARAAGRVSGSGCLFMDSSKPFSGAIAETLRTPWKSGCIPEASVPSFVRSGDSKDLEVLKSTGQFSATSFSDSRRSGFQEVAIPGYGGHVAGKVAKNLHGGTFRSENIWAASGTGLRSLRRTASEPFRITAPGNKSLEVAPHVPGFAGTIPGKVAESVYGCRFAEASEAANSLRQFNRYVTTDSWLKRGVWPVDRMATFKWNNRFVKMDAQDFLTFEQENEASKMNKLMGHTFGLHPPERNPHKPGDRFVHVKTEKDKAARLDPSKVRAAGASTYSSQLDSQRWQLHYTMQLGGGNQRPS